MPLPREETTPPVMNTNRVMDGQYTEPNRGAGSPQMSRRANVMGGAGPSPRPPPTRGGGVFLLVAGDGRALRRRRRRGGRRGGGRGFEQGTGDAGGAAVHQREGER